MSAAGIVFSNIHDDCISELTRVRTMASVPFGGKYRLVDVTLSNMVNSNIYNIKIITHYNYHSLMDHIGSGKEWDLARRNGGVKILPPFITAYDSKMRGTLYNNRLEALIGVSNFISTCSEECIVLCDCDAVYNADLRSVIDSHAKSGAVMTLVGVSSLLCTPDSSEGVYYLNSDENGDLISIGKGGRNPGAMCANIIVADRRFLLDAISEAASRGYTDFYRDVVWRNIGKAKIKCYDHSGTYMLISSLRSYFAASMKLLCPDIRRELFEAENRPIYTKVRNTAPTVYSKGASAKNSYIADGCVIEGSVENSILFRGVRVGRGSIVKNCVLMQNTNIGQRVSLNCVVADKNVCIRNGRTLSGHESIPFFLSKGTEV